MAAQLSSSIGSYVGTWGVGNEQALTSAIANVGPIAVLFYASDKLQHYSSGVFQDTTCPANIINHAVTAIGYGILP